MKKSRLAECALLSIKGNLKYQLEPVAILWISFFHYRIELILLFRLITQLGYEKRKKRDGGENLQAKVNVFQIDTDTRKMLSFVYIKEW